MLPSVELRCTKSDIQDKEKKRNDRVAKREGITNINNLQSILRWLGQYTGCQKCHSQLEMVETCVMLTLVVKAMTH